MKNYANESATDKNEPCWNCNLWHWGCEQALYNIVCIDFSMISDEIAQKLEDEREKTEDRIASILYYSQI